MSNTQENSYSGSNITVLEGLEAVRVRPAMYIGSTDSKGLHHLVWEVVDNSVDEALAGFCDRIEISITANNGIRIVDNGRGIPTDIHPKEKVGTLQVVMTKLHAGGKFDDSSYKVSAGLHGVGVSCVNALSTKLIATITRGGKIICQEFSRGHPIAPQHEIGEAPAGTHGTCIEFYPDSSIFTETEYCYDTIATRAREFAFLNKGLTLIVSDERAQNGEVRKEEFCYPGGLGSFIEYIDQNRKPLFQAPIVLSTEAGSYPLEVAIRYTDSYQDNLFSFVNNVNTYDGGTHITGFKTGLTRVVVKHANGKISKPKKDVEITGADVLEGLTAIIAIKIPQPQFEGQTKRKLGNSEVKSGVEVAIFKALDEFFAENPAITKIIAEKVYNTAEGRVAMRKAKDAVSRKGILEGGGLPGKLSDCSSRDPSKCELFLVEGDSAGGSAKQGRTREYQAILALKGKILNVEKANDIQIFSNDEIKTMIQSIGTGIRDDFKLEKLRYHKIIIMTDADVDGSHIQTLLLTFFYRYMRPLVDGGYVYLATPPLYRVKVGKQETYCFSDEDKDELVRSIRESGKKPELQRYKGLGEMNPDQLASTTMAPETRVLKQCCVEDAINADQIFSMLMGEEVEPRRKFIEANAYKVLDKLDV
ncbi:MAG: DNA topoisomerase (ATP-hydrolyzing) subunit B [Fibromonadaceae bacterium]|jgi:DNA gyrase subunit B|nr:DNA topoisomerase (ATP-hydrolyzing) subunit B [Fibromonadaceae bacterium]